MNNCQHRNAGRQRLGDPLADDLLVLAAADAQAANVQNVMGVLFSSTSFQGMFNLVRRLTCPSPLLSGTMMIRVIRQAVCVSCEPGMLLQQPC